MSINYCLLKIGNKIILATNLYAKTTQTTKILFLLKKYILTKITHLIVFLNQKLLLISQNKFFNNKHNY